MKKFFQNIFRSSAVTPSYAIPAGERVYAIGDIHGRLDLFENLISAIDADNADRGPAKTTIVLLGDLVDRGPDSAGVLEAARKLQERRNVRILQGNHEEMFLEALEDEDVLRQFLRFGGKETILSYPIDPDAYRELTLSELQQQLRTVVPASHLDFIRGFEDQIQIGDYLFVHAGIRPGVEPEQQATKDLRWIREPFLSDSSPRDFCVVHGHTITDEPDAQPTRIGIDTGGFRSGKLTAVGLELDRRWFLQGTEVSDLTPEAVTA